MNGQERIAAIKASAGWATLSAKHQEFVNSVEKWVETRPLTLGQESWVERVEKLVANPVDPNWFDFNNEENQKKRAYAIQHYKSTGYYHVQTSRMESEPTYMPDKEVWDRMWANKYINAAFKRWTAGARFAVGDMVVNKYYPHYYGPIAIIEEVRWSGSGWLYNAMPVSPPETFNNASKMGSVDEKHFLPASPRNLKKRI